MFENVFQTLASKRQKIAQDKHQRAKTLLEKLAKTPDKLTELEAEELLEAHGSEQAVSSRASSLARYFKIQSTPTDYSVAVKAQADAQAALKAHQVESIRLQEELIAKRTAAESILSGKAGETAQTAFVTRETMVEYEQLRAVLADHLGPYTPVLPSDATDIVHLAARPNPGDSLNLLKSKSDLNVAQKLIDHLNKASLMNTGQGKRAREAKTVASLEVNRLEAEAQQIKTLAAKKPTSLDGNLPPSGPTQPQGIRSDSILVAG